MGSVYALKYEIIAETFNLIAYQIILLYEISLYCVMMTNPYYKQPVKRSFRNNPLLTLLTGI